MERPRPVLRGSSWPPDHFVCILSVDYVSGQPGFKEGVRVYLLAGEDTRQPGLLGASLLRLMRREREREEGGKGRWGWGRGGGGGGRGRQREAEGGRGEDYRRLP